MQLAFWQNSIQTTPLAVSLCSCCYPSASIYFTSHTTVSLNLNKSGGTQKFVRANTMAVARVPVPESKEMAKVCCEHLRMTRGVRLLRTLLPMTVFLSPQHCCLPTSPVVAGQMKNCTCSFNVKDGSRGPSGDKAVGKVPGQKLT